jgi:hypothetical protein
MTDEVVTSRLRLRANRCPLDLAIDPPLQNHIRAVPYIQTGTTLGAAIVIFRYISVLHSKENRALSRSSEQLEDFDRWYAATKLSGLSYRDALAIFAAMWRHAALLNEDFPAPWEDDIQADIELARVLNASVNHR